jgi:hypothetical protein
MCADCGHIFAEPVPLSDESVEVDNVQLSRDLFYHMCALPKRVTPRHIGRRKGDSKR